MEKRIEKWESLRLEVQQFTPQEYVTTCKVEYNVEYQVKPDAEVASSLHVKWDTEQDKQYDKTDYDRKELNTDGSKPTGTLYFVGMGWGNKNGEGGNSWVNPGSNVYNETAMLTLGSGYKLYYLVSPLNLVPPEHNAAHVYAADEIANVIINVSQ